MHFCFLPPPFSMHSFPRPDGTLLLLNSLCIHTHPIFQEKKYFSRSYFGPCRYRMVRPYYGRMFSDLRRDGTEGEKNPLNRTRSVFFGKPDFVQCGFVYHTDAHTTYPSLLPPLFSSLSSLDHQANKTCLFFLIGERRSWGKRGACKCPPSSVPQRSNLIALSTVCCSCPVSQAILGGDSSSPSSLSTSPGGHEMKNGNNFLTVLLKKAISTN